MLTQVSYWFLSQIETHISSNSIIQFNLYSKIYDDLNQLILLSTNPFFCNFISWAFAFERYVFWSLVSQVEGAPIITGQFANIFIRRIDSTTLRNAAWSRQSTFTCQTTGELSFPEKTLKIVSFILINIICHFKNNKE